MLQYVIYTLIIVVCSIIDSYVKPFSWNFESFWLLLLGSYNNVLRFLGIDYTVQFNPLDVHGVSNVMLTLNRAFQHLFDRLTSDVAPHDQVRLILNSQQLDKSISLPFLQRERLTPQRFLAAVERVVQSNDQFTLDDSVSVNVVHVVRW
jgi:hypothetical protein